MFWIDLLGSFFRGLASGSTPRQVAAGFTLGYLIGLMPFLSLQTFIFAFLLLLLNVNFAAGVFAFMLAGLIAFLFDPLLHQLGLWALTLPSMEGFWTTLNNMPVAPLTRFYNTVSMGAMIFALLSFSPVYLGFKKFVIVYRERLLERIRRLKVVRAIQGSTVYLWIERVMRAGGAV